MYRVCHIRPLLSVIHAWTVCVASRPRAHLLPTIIFFQLLGVHLGSTGCAMGLCGCSLPSTPPRVLCPADSSCCLLRSSLSSVHWVRNDCPRRCRGSGTCLQTENSRHHSTPYCFSSSQEYSLTLALVPNMKKFASHMRLRCTFPTGKFSQH